MVVVFLGRGERTQTFDLPVPNRARYQLRHTPIDARVIVANYFGFDQRLDREKSFDYRDAQEPPYQQYGAERYDSVENRYGDGNSDHDEWE